MSRGASKSDKPTDRRCDKPFEKILKKSFGKPLDKTTKVWYNNNVIKGGDLHRERKENTYEVHCNHQ